MLVGVIGLGRFGAFWAKILASRFRVIAYDRSAMRAAPEGVEKGSLEEVCAADALFLCVAIRALPEVLKLIAPRVGNDCLVADTCSVKMAPKQWMLDALPKNVSIIATHPMFGPESGKDGVKGLNLMMDPVRTNPDQERFWFSSFSALGLNVVRMDCERHDREAAYSQALTHFVGRTLFGMGLPRTSIATRWYERLYAVSEQCVRDAPELFYDMQTLNPYAAEMRQAVLAALTMTMNELGDAP